MNNDKLGVVVCCYNPDLDKLKKTLYSISLQKNINMDIIIADDGSKNNYKDEILDFCNYIDLKNVKCSFLENNQGTICNIIAALKMLSTKYVKTISPGDYFYDENTLSCMYNKAISTNADVCFGDAIYYSNEKEFKVYNVINPVINVYRSNPNYKKIFNLLVKYKFFLLGAAVLYNKNKFLNNLVKINEYGVKYCEDLSTLLFATDKNIFTYIDIPVVWYEYGTGISTAFTNGNEKSLVEIDDELFFLKAYPNIYNSNCLIRKNKLWIYIFMKNRLLGKIMSFVLFPSKIICKIKIIINKNKTIEYDNTKFKKIEDFVNGLSNN